MKNIKQFLKTNIIKIFLILLIVIGKLWFIGFLLLSLGITNSYHPNTILMNYGLYLGYVFIVLVILNFIYLIYILIRKKYSEIKKVLIIFISIILIFFVSVNIKREHNVEIYLQDQKFLIPAEYDPKNISSQIGGKYFNIRVLYPSFSPFYSIDQYERGKFNTLDLAINFEKPHNFEKCMIQENPDYEENSYLGRLDECHSIQYFFNDKYYYHVGLYTNYGGKKIIFETQRDLERFKKRVIDLFNSFEEK